MNYIHELYGKLTTWRKKFVCLCRLVSCSSCTSQFCVKMPKKRKKTHEKKEASKKDHIGMDLDNVRDTSNVILYLYYEMYKRSETACNLPDKNTSFALLSHLSRGNKYFPLSVRIRK